MEMVYGCTDRWSLRQVSLHTLVSLQEEALDGFVTPESLSGANQYFCDKCLKKCDGQKVRSYRVRFGLRISPYYGGFLIMEVNLYSKVISMGPE